MRFFGPLGSRAELLLSTWLLLVSSLALLNQQDINAFGVSGWMRPNVGLGRVRILGM